MAVTLNATHDPKRQSWVESANRDDSDFPLQNLPFGVFRRSGDNRTRIGIAIGDRVFDLHAAAGAGLLPASLREVCLRPKLNDLMGAGIGAWSALRLAASELLGADSCPSAQRPRVEECLLSQSSVEMVLPAHIGDYTDFYASIHHATNVGALFRPDQPLLPNYKWVPIGYHGRSSSIVPSGAAILRPSGQLKPPSATTPTFGPCRQLDYELELGAFVGSGNAQGQPISVESAASHLFGLVLLNDWSARDIQSWEYQPLGPFLAKNFATTISPWVVTMEALAPFRVAPPPRGAGDPPPLPYLSDPIEATEGALDIMLEVSLSTVRMRANGQPPHRLVRSNARHLYWTLGQLVAHHTSNGCNLVAGDLLGTGTISGPEPEAAGSLLELSKRGTAPVKLPDGDERTFLVDGDEVFLQAYAEGPGHRRIGFGACRGVVVAARTAVADQR